LIKLGLIGKKIGHSKSQEMYEKILNRPVNYTLLDYEKPTDIPPLSVLLKTYNGLSVTAPYKSFLYNEELAENRIKPFGSTNCIRLVDDSVQMTNTDFLAINEILPSLIINYSIKKCIVLGNGSMAAIVIALLKSRLIPFVQLYRQRDGDLNLLNFNSICNDSPSEQLMINCCSRDFVLKAAIPKQIVFWDLNYSMNEHEYLRQVCQYHDGLDLLYKQAQHALKYWSIA